MIFTKIPRARAFLTLSKTGAFCADHCEERQGPGLRQDRRQPQEAHREGPLLGVLHGHDRTTPWAASTPTRRRRYSTGRGTLFRASTPRARPSTDFEQSLPFRPRLNLLQRISPRPEVSQCLLVSLEKRASSPSNSGRTLFLLQSLQKSMRAQKLNILGLQSQKS